MKKPVGKRRDDDNEGGFVLLARFPELWQADLAVSLLASEGIEAWSADESLINGTDHSTDMGGVGVLVHEADAVDAWSILQMAERGELALPDEQGEHYGEKSRRRAEGPQTSPRDMVIESRNQEHETRDSMVIRCPRCGSENIERKGGFKALFSPGNRCRVCRWEWKGHIQRQD